MAKDTRVTFDPPAQVPNKPCNKVRHNRVTERQISYEDAENCVNEMSESFPALSTRAQRLMRQVSGSFNNRTIKVALILSVILNLILGIPFGIFFGFWMSQRNDASLRSSVAGSAPSVDSFERLVDEKSYTLVESCFPCSDSDLGLDSRVKVKSKNNICCTDDKVLHVEGSPYFCVTSEVFRRRCIGSVQINQPPPCNPGADNSRARENSEAAAHLMLDVDETKRKSNNTQALAQAEIPLIWIAKDQEHLTFVGNEVEYFNGSITIRKTGKYHLYSHVTLSTIENPLPAEEKIIVHSLIWKSRGVSKNLLFAQVTIKRNEVKSTNIEGSFELRDGDVLTVYLSHPSFLKNVRPANVFGLFML